jgi:hypothetical protein
MALDKTAQTDRLIADAVRNRLGREAGYRDQALKIYPWICGRCAREFTRQNLRELTVHHRNHNHDDNPGRRQQLGTPLPLLPRQRTRKATRRRSCAPERPPVAGRESRGIGDGAAVCQPQGPPEAQLKRRPWSDHPMTENIP